MDAVYGALRGALPGGDGVVLKNVTLKREGGEFQFTDGSVYFFAPVNGHVTGAVFVGTGQFRLLPPDAAESRALARLTKSELMQQDFTTLVLRFTDGTDEELRKDGSGPAAAPAGHVASAARDLATAFRKTLHDNMTLRVLQDVLQPAAVRGGYFLASFHMGSSLTGRDALFSVDPERFPDQVELATWNDWGTQVWAGYRMSEHASADDVRSRVTEEKIDVAFDRGGKMSCATETTLTMNTDNVRVISLNLYPTLRVTGVFDANGQALDYVQEDKDQDPDFAIILPKPAKRGETVRVLTKYAGKDALRRDGNTMYYLMGGARDSWYPSSSRGFGDFVQFQMTFHVPSGLDIVATGKQVSSTKEPGGKRVVWTTDSPIPVAGFNLGAFKSVQKKTPAGFGISAWANTDLPDSLTPFVERLDLGTMTTTSALGNEADQGNAAIQIYTDFFGKLPYDHVALTEQSACDYGQSWPMLVYLPICAFWDSTIQHRLGLLDRDAMFWQEVTPHEVAHQWWGQLVGFSSYRDQWMSEGFAQFSAGLYLMYTRKTMDDYREFWKDQRERLLKKNERGLRPEDVGPLTMGYRVNNDKTGNWVYQNLIYSKGAYILHMLEMMYWTPKDQQETFKHSMQEFVKEYAGKAATTEDFKASIEKTMPKWLDLDGNGKLDWFFNEYVYGTELPHYEVKAEFTTDAEGVTSMHYHVEQANVSREFRMLVPLYLQMQNGNTVKIGSLIMRGAETSDSTAKLGKLPSPAKKLLVNYNADVLSD